MIRFASMSAFVDHFARVPAAVEVAQREGLKQATQLLRDRARDALGLYQDAVGPFPAWQQLAASTQVERLAAGYTPNDPLLRTGELRDSIQDEVIDAAHGRVFTDNPHAAALEHGTRHIPPRPFMGTAEFRHGDEAAAKVEEAVVAAYAGVPVRAKG